MTSQPGGSPDSSFKGTASEDISPLTEGVHIYIEARPAVPQNLTFDIMGPLSSLLPTQACVHCHTQPTDKSAMFQYNWWLK